jgi:membrane-associated phospholipid phosphatase
VIVSEIGRLSRIISVDLVFRDHAPEWDRRMFLLNWLGRSLMLGDDGPDARFTMTITWGILAGFFIVDAIWLCCSRLGFAASNWNSLFGLTLSSIAALSLCRLIAHRLAGNPDWIAGPLRKAVDRIGLAAVAFLVFGLLAAAVIMCCCLGAGMALPLQDAPLAAIDRRLGFDWAGFVTFANAHSAASRLLVNAYQATAWMLVGTIVWLCISGRGQRLAEFMAVSCLTSVGVAVGMLLLPAAGAYSYYQPAHLIFSNFSQNAGMWHYGLLMALRTAAAPVIDFAVPNSNCLVTFPSGHTVLAIIIPHALRGSRWTFFPALLFGATMMVSTIPEGGHYLIDVIAGALIAVSAILIVRIPHRVPQHSTANCTMVWPVRGAGHARPVTQD